MILVGVGGDGQRVSLVLTGADCQLAKEMEPLEAIRLAHRLIDEALRVHNKTPLAEAGGASGKGVINAKGNGADISHRPVSRKVSEACDDRIQLPDDERVKLRRARYLKRITCKAMAHQLGIPVTTFSNYECGDRRVPSAVLEAWREALR